MQTCWKRLDKIRDKCMPLFNEILPNKPTVHVALNNHNQMHRKKDQSYGKSAVSHIETAYYARQHMEIFLIPNSTKIKTPFGIAFAVEAGVEVKINGEVSLTKWEIKGKIIGYRVDKPRLVDEAKLNANDIENGFLWPVVRWEVLWMPGFQPVPPVSYIEQLVQPSRLAWVDSNASDWEVVTNLSRRWKAPNATSAISVLTKRYQL